MVVISQSILVDITQILYSVQSVLSGSVVTCCCKPSSLTEIWVCCVKPKFHYADFIVTSATNPWRPRWFVRDVADFPVTCRGRRRFFPFPRRKRAGCRLVTGIFETISTCRDGLKARNISVTSPKLPRGVGPNGIWALSVHVCISWYQQCANYSRVVAMLAEPAVLFAAVV